MTALSTLVGGGGGGHPYPSGVHVGSRFVNAFAANGAINEDYLLPFVPRADVTVDKLWWVRTDATAGNIYMALVDRSGNRLDDCAVDSSTTTGVHEIESTNFDLTAGTWYGIILNQSVDTAAVDPLAAADEEVAAAIAYANDHPLDFGLFTSGTFPSFGITAVTAIKSRTNAAVPDPLTMTGWSNTNARVPLMGIVPA